MIKQIVQRKILEGNETAFIFDNKSYIYLIKNYSHSDIFVSFFPNFNQNEAIKIAASMGQKVVASEKFVPETDTIYILGTGEVEVQQL